MWRNKRLRIAALVLLAIILIIVIWRIRASVKEVAVIRPVRREVVELVVASGYLAAVRQSDVGTQISGVIAQVYVREGDAVYAGELLALLRREDLLAQMNQARLAVATARSQFAQAARPALPSDIARARAELAQARQVNTAHLEAARQRLAQLQRGGRPEERARAQAALEQARASRRQAELDVERQRLLFSRGAIPRADLDRAETALTQARSQERQAEENLALAIKPASVEEIAQARSDVRAAQAMLNTSVQIARDNLQTLLSQPRPEDVSVARARLSEAQASLKTAEDEAAKAKIYAPFAGIVVKRNADPGGSVLPGQLLFTVADMSRTEIVVETDESNLPKLSVGQPATIIAPAYQNRPFKAALVRIGPQVNFQRGVVQLRLRPVQLPSYARPDMTVDVNIEVARIPNALALPASAVLQPEENPYVFVVEDGRARRRNVRVRALSTDWAAVEGISPDSAVILQGTEVRPGQRVSIAEEK
ncbi:MAG TPA: hypothetical protein DCL60_00585 [Armatimonadetes bacterium]|nr:hypothetical protein [Armatimonadota bacterium]